jgi:hypothetical protein
MYHFSIWHKISAGRRLTGETGCIIRIPQGPDTGRYQLEAVVHRLIHPMRKGSDEIEFEEQNLWILDDRLTYHDFMESDKELRVSDHLENESQTRPDLLVVFNRTLTFREGRDPTTSFVIIEFKKPDRRSFERSPLAQVYCRSRRSIAKNCRSVLHHKSWKTLVDQSTLSIGRDCQ